MPYENAPGSLLAIADGCTCPMAKNNFGAGNDLGEKWGYFVRPDCPIHGHGLKVALNGQLAHTKNVDISSIGLCCKKSASFTKNG